MKLLGICLGLALCLTPSLQDQAAEPVYNDASKAMHRAMDELRRQNPIEVARNFSQLLLQTLPKEEVQTKVVEIKDKAQNLFRNLTHPANVRIFMRLIRDSKIKKKGEIIRITMNFLNPQNLVPEGVVHTLKTLDPLTVSEMTGIFIEYFKIIEPQVLGHDYDSLLKYINEDDIKEFVLQLFEIFKETPEKDLLWIVDKIREEGSEFGKAADQLLHADGETLINNWQTNGEKTTREKVKQLLTDTQKLSQMEKVTDHIPNIISAFKGGAIHLIQNLLIDIKNETADIDPKALLESMNGTIKNVKSFLKTALEFVDIDSLGVQAEQFLDHVKGMDRENVKNALETAQMFIPSAEQLVETLESSNNPLLKKVPIKKLGDVLETVEKAKIPDPLLNIGIDVFLKLVRRIDSNKFKNVVEILARQLRIDNEVYIVFRSIFLNVLKDHLKSFSHFNVSSTESWDEIEQEVIKGMKLINETLITDVAKQLLDDVKLLNASRAADAAGDATVVIKDIMSDNLLETILDDPTKIFDSLNKTIVYDIAYLFLDIIQIIDEESFYRHCKDLASLAGADLNKKIDIFIDEILKQFDRVENGKKVAEKLHISQVASYFKNFVEFANLGEICLDAKLLIIGTKYIDDETKADVAESAWKLLMTLKKFLLGEPFKKITAQQVEELMEILQGTHAALVKSNKHNPDDFKTAAVRLAIRKVDEYAERSEMKLNLPPLIEGEMEPDNFDLVDWDMTDDGWIFSSKLPFEDNRQLPRVEPTKKNSVPTTTTTETTPYTSSQAPTTTSTMRTSVTTKHPKDTTILAATTTTMRPSVTTNHPNDTTTQAATTTTMRPSATTKHPKDTTIQAATTTTMRPSITTKHPNDTTTQAATTTTSSPKTEKTERPVQNHTEESTILEKDLTVLKGEVYGLIEGDEEVCSKHVREMFSLTVTGASLSETSWKSKLYNSKYGVHQHASATTPSKRKSCVLMKSLDSSFQGQYCNATDSSDLTGEILGLCIPSTCSEVEFNKIFGGNLTVVLGSCSTTDDSGIFNQSNLCWIALGVLLSLALICGITECRKRSLKRKTVNF